MKKSPKTSRKSSTTDRGRELKFKCRKCGCGSFLEGGGHIIELMPDQRDLKEIWSDGRVETYEPMGYGDCKSSYFCGECGEIIENMFGYGFQGRKSFAMCLAAENNRIINYKEPTPPKHDGLTSVMSSFKGIKGDLPFTCPKCGWPKITEYYAEKASIAFFSDGSFELGDSHCADGLSTFTCFNCHYVLHDADLVDSERLINPVLDPLLLRTKAVRSNVCNYATLIEHLKRHAG